jgi:hypothetical protein
MIPTAHLIFENGRVTTLDPRHPEAKEVVIAGGRIAGVDNSAEFQRGPDTKVIDLKGSRGFMIRTSTSFAADLAASLAPWRATVIAVSLLEA